MASWRSVYKHNISLQIVFFLIADKNKYKKDGTELLEDGANGTTR